MRAQGGYRVDGDGNLRICVFVELERLWCHVHARTELRMPNLGTGKASGGRGSLVRGRAAAQPGPVYSRVPLTGAGCYRVSLDCGNRLRVAVLGCHVAASCTSRAVPAGGGGWPHTRPHALSRRLICRTHCVSWDQSRKLVWDLFRGTVESHVGSACGSGCPRVGSPGLVWLAAVRHHEKWYGESRVLILILCCRSTRACS